MVTDELVHELGRGERSGGGAHTALPHEAFLGEAEHQELLVEGRGGVVLVGGDELDLGQGEEELAVLEGRGLLLGQLGENGGGAKERMRGGQGGREKERGKEKTTVVRRRRRRRRGRRWGKGNGSANRACWPIWE